MKVIDKTSSVRHVEHLAVCGMRDLLGIDGVSVVPWIKSIELAELIRDPRNFNGILMDKEIEETVIAAGRNYDNSTIGVTVMLNPRLELRWDFFASCNKSAPAEFQTVAFALIRLFKGVEIRPGEPCFGQMQRLSRGVHPKDDSVPGGGLRIGIARFEAHIDRGWNTILDLNGLVTDNLAEIRRYLKRAQTMR